MKRLLVGAVFAAVLAAPALASAAGPGPGGDPRSAPPDRNAGSHAVVAEDLDPSAAATARIPGLLIRDVIKSAHQPPGSLIAQAEPSIAIDPRSPGRIAITSFYDYWFYGNRRASLWYSTDGGTTWSRQDTIPAGPGVTSRNTFGPCDQTIDYGRDHRLYGAFLVCNLKSGVTSLVTGSTTDPTRSSAWRWCAHGTDGCPADPDPNSSVDQPWLEVNRDPAHAGRDNAYVAYDNFYSIPGGFASVSRVAASGANPVNFTVDSVAGDARPLATNPGLRLGKDPRSGAMYAVYERSATTGTISKKIVTYMLNRSTDGGRTWSLNGRADGIPIATELSKQAPYYRFCGVNALLGGITHVTVDPGNGDVYVAYGADRGTRNNQIYVRPVTGGRSSGDVEVGRATLVDPAADQALPSVAVTGNGTVGILYDTCEGTTASGLPKFSARFARSFDHGRSFGPPLVLSRFLSSQAPSDDIRQRVLGDYQQLKTVGDTFYGAFAGNRAAFGGSVSATDPIFFKFRQH